MSSQDLFEMMASVTSVNSKPLDFTLARLALLSLVRSDAISMSVSQSSNLVESYSLKTGISYSNKFVRLDCFYMVHKVSIYCHITSPRGSAGAGGCGWRMAIKRFWSSHCMWSKVSSGCPSPAATPWHKSFISLVSAVNLSWLWYTKSLGCATASELPRTTVVSELCMLSLLISACSASSSRISKPLSTGINTFHITDICCWTHIPVQLHIYVLLHYYCSLHKDPIITAHIL